MVSEFRVVRLNRLVASVALLVALQATASAAPTTPPRERPGVVQLAGRNTIIAERTSSIEVVLPRKVNLPLETRERAKAGPAPWLTFEGDGRLVGLILAQQRPTGLEGGSYTDWFSGLVATRARSCAGCAGKTVNTLFVDGRGSHGRATLEAGTYRLYMLTDGGAVTVTLELAGLEGVADLEVKLPSTLDSRTPVARIDQTDDLTVYTAGANYEMESSEGLFISVNVVRDVKFHGGMFNQCLSAERPIPDEVEETGCMPGGIVDNHLDRQSIVQPTNTGFIVTAFFGVTDEFDNAFNGDAHLEHYSLQVLSPGPMGELWSQTALLSF